MGEGEGGMFQENSMETCILSRVKQITSPGWMHETSARTWCTGKTQRDQVEREVGGGIRMDNTCKSMADSVNVWQKPLQYCKVISLPLIKINGKKKKNWLAWSPCCPRDSQESSPALLFKSINSSVLSLLYGPTLTSVHDYWQNHTFDHIKYQKYFMTVCI